MGDVGVYVRIMPQGTDTNMEAVLEAVRTVLGDKVRKAEVKPFVFGIKVVEAFFVVPDTEGILDNTVEELKKIDGVENVEVLEVSLV